MTNRSAELVDLEAIRAGCSIGPLPQWQRDVFESLSRADRQMIVRIAPLTVTPAVWICLERIVETLRDAAGGPLTPGQCADVLEAFHGLRRFHARYLMGLRLCLRARRALSASRALRRWAGPGWGRAALRWLALAAGGFRRPGARDAKVGGEAA